MPKELNIFRRFTEWGTRLLSRIETEPFLKARLTMALLYFVFAAIMSITIALIIDATTARIFSEAFLHPEAITAEEVTAQVEQVRWAFRIFNLAVFAIGVYFLVGITLRPIRKAAEFQKRFIANISHELRTPLTIAKTETEVALRDRETLTKEQAIELLEQNLKDITRVSRIIQFLTVLSDLSEKKARDTSEPVTLSSVAKRVHENYVERADLKTPVVLTIESNAKVWGNPVALEKLLSNLLRNSLAHTSPDGTITIKVAEEKGRGVLSVEDTGSGIPTKDLPNIFEPFYRAENSSREGSGLGLSIVREIARMHDARISMTSEVGEGTTVSITFPRTT